MYNLNKKQKTILVIIAILIVCGISYYVYTKDNELFMGTEELAVESKSESQDGEKVGETQEDKTQKSDTYSDSIIIVYITGAVNKEGVIELKPKSRIADAIDKSGGLRDDANIDEINLAYILEDGMKIHIPTNEEKEQEKKQQEDEEQHSKLEDETSKYVSTNSGIDVESSSINQSVSASTNTKVNINTATQTELETLPGIGPSTALKIIKYRTENGKFATIEAIKEVSGIGESKFNNIKELIYV